MIPPTLAESEIPFIPYSDEPTLGSEICGKLDRIIELLERMVQPEEESSDELACPSCGSDEVEEYTTEDETKKAVCTTCNHRFAPGLLSG